MQKIGRPMQRNSPDHLTVGGVPLHEIWKVYAEASTSSDKQDNPHFGCDMNSRIVYLDERLSCRRLTVAKFGIGKADGSSNAATAANDE